MFVLGLNCAYHESAVALLDDGDLVAFAEEERFSRRRHEKDARVDNADLLPDAAIRFCLDLAGIDWSEVDYVGFSLDPMERLKRNLAHQHPYRPTEDDFGTSAGERRFFDQLQNTRSKLRSRGFRGSFLFLDHHDCHAASSFFVSTFDSAAAIVIDGIGEFECTTIYAGEGNRIERIHELCFPDSLGFLWEKLAAFLGFSRYDAAKVMGLASYGDPEPHRQVFGELVQTGRFHTVDDRIAKFRATAYDNLERLFGLGKRSSPVESISSATQPYADLAATLQEATEDSVLDLGRFAREKGYSRLCLSGGVGLNCVANGKLLTEGIFDDVFIQPAANDAGTALGAAFLIWHQVLGMPRCFVFESPYWGPEYPDSVIRGQLDRGGLVYQEHDDVAKTTAQLIAEGNVVSWFQGRMEVGPRALGNRSILADPRNAQMRSILNRKVKHRESFRPFCPSVLEEEAPHWFDLDESPLSPALYMLSTYRARPLQAAKIPAVVHVDGTSRVQLVCRHLNPRYHRLIGEFAQLTGVPMLLNTSFNDSEPIVCSPEDAVNTFMGTEIDYLVAGNCVVAKADNQMSDRFAADTVASGG